MLDLIEFSKAKFAVSENGTVIEPLIIKRIGTGDGIVSVRVSLVSGSGTVGRDVQRLVQTVTWQSGDKTDKTIEVVPIPDNYSEVKESVFIKLSAIKGASYGSIRVAGVEILDSINLVDSVQDNDLLQLVRGNEQVSLPLATFKDGLDVKGRPPIPLQIWDDNNDTVEFFLDTENGDDTADGRSPTTAVKTWEKAISILKEKRFSWNWNTYLRIKGTLQCPLNIEDLYGDVPDYWTDAVLTLTKWDNGDKWTLRGTDDENITKLAFLSDSTKIELRIEDVILDIPLKMVFHNLLTSWATTDIKPGANIHSPFMIFSEGIHWTNDFNIDAVNVSQYQRIGISINANAFAMINGTHTFTNDVTQDDEYIRVEYGGKAIVHNLRCVSPRSKKIIVRKLSEVCASRWDNCYFQKDPSGTLRYDDDRREEYSTTLFFPTLTNGRYFACRAPKRGRLAWWMITAQSGSGTFQMDANGTRWGDPLTASPFNNYDPHLIRDMNFDSPWQGAFSFYLNVENASNLTNVSVQMSWRDY